MCVKNLHFFSLSTTLIDTKLTHQMTHKMRYGGSTRPAHLFNIHLQRWTPDTLSDTSTIGSKYCQNQTSILNVWSRANRNSFVRFFTLFISVSEQLTSLLANLAASVFKAHTLTSYCFTAKNAIL